MISSSAHVSSSVCDRPHQELTAATERNARSSLHKNARLAGDHETGVSRDKRSSSLLLTARIRDVEMPLRCCTPSLHCSKKIASIGAERGLPLGAIDLTEGLGRPISAWTSRFHC